MMNPSQPIRMVFGKRPSGAAGIVRALVNRKNAPSPEKISAVMDNVRPDPGHVNAFNRICQVPDTDYSTPFATCIP